MLQVEHAVQGPPAGSSGHKVPYLDVANTWSADQTIKLSGPSLILDRTDANGAGLYGLKGGLNRWDMEFGNNAAESGTDGVGSDLVLTRYHNDGSWWSAPLFISRQTGMVNFSHDVTINGITYFYTAPMIILSGTGTAMSVVSTDPGAAAAPDFAIFRDSASPAVSDAIGRLLFQGRNSSAAVVSYAQDSVVINNATAASESATYSIATYQAGASAARLGIAAGVVINGAAGAAPAGGDKGVGTLNVATALYENNVALTAKYGQLAVANTWSAAQIFTNTVAGTIFSIISTDPGAGNGPQIDLIRDSASPAASDVLANIRYMGRDSSNAQIVFASIYTRLDNPTAGAAAGTLIFQANPGTGNAQRLALSAGLYTYNAVGGDKGLDTINATALYEAGTALTAKYGQLAVGNTWTAAQTITMTTANAVPLTLISTDAGAGSGPNLNLFRDSASPANSDTISQISFAGRNSANAFTTYAAITGIIAGATAGSEGAWLTFFTESAGAYNWRFTMASGLFSQNAAGSDMGVDTINVKAYYENGSPLTSRYAAGAGAGNILRRNGGFEIWQRGAGGAAIINVPAGITGGQYTADGWYLATGANQAYTVQQQGGFPSQSQFCAKVLRTAGQTGVTAQIFGFPLDTDEIFPMLGKFVRLSLWLKAGLNWSPTSGNLTIFLQAGDGTPVRLSASAYTNSTQVIGAIQSLSTTWTRYEFGAAAVVPTTTRQMEVAFQWTPVGTAGADDSFFVDDVQLEIVPAATGYVASSFQRLLFEEQLLLCQRHYCKTFPYGTAPAFSLGNASGEDRWCGSVIAAGSTIWQHVFPTLMRVVPTGSIYNTGAANSQVRNQSLGVDCSSSSLTFGSAREAQLVGVAPTSSAVGNIYGAHATFDAGI